MGRRGIKKALAKLRYRPKGMMAPRNRAIIAAPVQRVKKQRQEEE